MSAIETIVRLKGPDIGRPELVNVDGSHIKIQKIVPARQQAHCSIKPPGGQSMTYIVGYGKKPTLAIHEEGVPFSGDGCSIRRNPSYLSGS